MVKVIPQSFKYVSPNPEGGGNNRITEVQIRWPLETIGPEPAPEALPAS